MQPGARGCLRWMSIPILTPPAVSYTVLLFNISAKNKPLWAKWPATDYNRAIWRIQMTKEKIDLPLSESRKAVE